MKSKTYVQFFETRNGKQVEPCGSDQVFILDGRNCLHIQMQDARYQAHRLRNVQPHYTHFQIRRGSFTEYREVTAVHSL